MPIVVNDFVWTQTSSSIHIKVPISAVKHEKVDIFTTDSYIKANYSPFLFEALLLHEVDSSKSKCVIKNDLIVFDLVKKQELEWESLEKRLSKTDRMKLKLEIVEKCQEKAKQDFEEKRVRKSNLDRFTVQQAMDIDSKQHALMDSRRDEERKRAMDALEDWRMSKNYSKVREVTKSKFLENNHGSGPKIVELSSSEDETEENLHKGSRLVAKPAPRIEAKKINTSRPIKTLVKSDFVEIKKQEVANRVLPKLRETAELEITHTPRTFPTPSRESTAKEEEAWIKNITLARRATGFVSEDLRPEEQDPQWCKEKGDEFFRRGNYLGAISAYTHGIQLSEKLPTLFANRAATHFALGNFNKCVNDCSTALDLMVPHCEGNRRSRAKCIARRAAALARLGLLNKAIDEMKAASKLLPEDENIKKDIYDMERAWEQNPDSD